MGKINYLMSLIIIFYSHSPYEIKLYFYFRERPERPKQNILDIHTKFYY